MAADILLYDFNLIRPHGGDNRNMAVQTICEDNQITRLRRDGPAISILQQATLFVQCSGWRVLIEEILGVAPDVGHAMVEGLVEKALHKLDALPFLPEIISVGGEVTSVGARYEGAVVVHRHTAKRIHFCGGRFLSLNNQANNPECGERG